MSARDQLIEARAKAIRDYVGADGDPRIYGPHAAATLDADLASPELLLDVLLEATKGCETCGGRGVAASCRCVPGLRHACEPCPTCRGSGRVPSLDRATLLAKLVDAGVLRENRVSNGDGKGGQFVTATGTVSTYWKPATSRVVSYSRVVPSGDGSTK